MEAKNRFSFISTQGFADRLRRRRLALGLRKQDLAAQVGVSLTTIQQYENGQLPKGEFAVRLGAALRCSLDWLLAGQGNVEGALQEQWAGLHVFQHAGDAVQLLRGPEQGTLGGLLLAAGVLRQETLELFQGSCVHVGYSLSEDGHGVPRRMAAEKLCCPKVFFCPEKAGPARCIHCH